jgi:4-amino-4-deoxy-L-arabinose transferase-like glycosyltransferase
VNNRFRITDWLLLLAVPSFFFFWKLALFGLIGADEPRYAQVAREMLARHDWITPTLGGSPWLEKPPLYYWQAMLAYRIFGVSDWAARLPSAFDAFLLVLAIYWFLRRFRPGFEVDGALMLATAAGMVGYARAASMDMALAATFAVAMLTWFAWFESSSRGYLAAFYAFLALAMLAKGPVAPFLAASIIVILAGLQRSPQIIWKTLSPPGIVLFCVIALPWYILVQLRNPQFFHAFIVEHNLARFGTNLYHHPEPFWYYIPVTLLSWLPWAVFVVVALVWAFRKFRDSDSDALSKFLVIWIAVVVVFFSISRSKLPGYVLPALPPGIVLLAEYVRKKIIERPRAICASLHAFAAGCLVFCALIIQYILLQHRVPWGSTVAVPLCVALATAIGVFILLLKDGYRILRLVTLVPAVLALALILRFGGLALDNSLSARPVWISLSKFNPDHLPVAVFLVPRETEFGLHFYANQKIPRYELGFVPGQEHLVVAAEGYPKGVAKAAGRKVVYLGNSPAQKLDYFYVPGR